MDRKPENTNFPAKTGMDFFIFLSCGNKKDTVNCIY